MMMNRAKLKKLQSFKRRNGSTKIFLSDDHEWISRRSKLLLDAIPKLHRQFEMVAKTIESTTNNNNNNKVFPLFSEQNHKLMWKAVPYREDQKQAAILVPLLTVQGEPSLLFTTRSSHLPSHAAEVSFPGGHFSIGVDKSLEDTALREAREELLGNCPWENIQIIGRATTVPSIRGNPVTPIISVLPYDLDDSTTDYMKSIFPGCPGEVENVFAVKLRELIQVETSQPSERFRANIPLFPTFDGHKIWGLTAAVVRPILHTLFRPVFDLPKSVASRNTNNKNDRLSPEIATTEPTGFEEDLEETMKIPWDRQC